MTGVPFGPGSCASHRAAKASRPEASIPNAAIDVLADLANAMQEEFNRVAGTDNWRLHDTPKLPDEQFNKLLTIFGEGNYRIMVGSQGNFRIRDGKSETCEPWTRASLLISPEAVENARQYASAIEARSDATGTGAAEGESATAESGDAQLLSPHPKGQTRSNKSRPVT